MDEQNRITRKSLLKSSIFGLIAVGLPGIAAGESSVRSNVNSESPDLRDSRYPAIPLEIAAEVVGISHFDLDKLKKIVDARPELAKANWDWGFGDWESAIGAASHTGRRDIVSYLVSKGATPTIFTSAMFGMYESVKSMIESYPGIQKNLGPHGISLLQHARLGLSAEGNDKGKTQKLLDYLEALGDADGLQYLPVEEKDREKYLGDYTYGEGANDGFTVRLNMKKSLSLGKLGKFGGALYRIGENQFTYNGAPSVVIDFEMENGKVVSLTINEPGLVLKATRV